MGHRRDLNTLSSGERTTLVNLMLNYINDAVVWSHNPNNPNAIVHHEGEHGFTTHRSFIGLLEDWLASNGGGRFVPLPMWNPANPIPAEFNVVKPTDTGVARPPLVNLNPNLPRPAGLNPPALCGIADATTLWNDHTDGWHGLVHVTIGGTMGSIQIAPAAPIFFCWHAFVDEIYDDYFRCRWSGWENLGGVIIAAPAVSSWSANRLDCFVRGTDNAMWHKWWDGAAWRGWESLGGVLFSAPAAVSWGANRIDCFVRGTDNAMWHKWWDGAAWSGWESLGGILTSAPAVASWGPNRLDCFVRGTDNAMWHKWWDGAAWSGWESLGGIIMSPPATVSWGANRIDCFALGTDGAVWHRWWDGAAWRGWESLGGVFVGGLAVSSRGANRLDLFGRGRRNVLWYKWVNRTVAHGQPGTWSGWHRLGGVIEDEPAAVSWGPSRIDCFVRGANNSMWHKWWT